VPNRGCSRAPSFAQPRAASIARSNNTGLLRSSLRKRRSKNPSAFTAIGAFVGMSYVDALRHRINVCVRAMPRLICALSPLTCNITGKLATNSSASGSTSSGATSRKAHAARNG
jgi:hypothetical protein